MKQAEDRLRAMLEVTYAAERKKFGQELLAKREVRDDECVPKRHAFYLEQVEYGERERKALDRLTVKLTDEHTDDVAKIHEHHQRELEELHSK